MRNAIGLGALIAVLSLSQTYGGPSKKSVKAEAVKVENCHVTSVEAECTAERDHSKAISTLSSEDIVE